ncbi:MAG TPA: FCD domain-containing protein [Bryobacteraceae bacterium]|nr:FCD domain-containing protein [Bryobacteraceae bacterium]
MLLEIAKRSASKPKSGRPQLNRIAFDRIKQDIIRCVLEPGKQVTEAQLAGRYALGKAPIRAALLGLCQSGFVRAIPRRGYAITAVTVGDVQDITQVRLLLEPTAARLAAGRIGSEDLARLNALCHVRYTPGERSRASAVAAHRELHLLIARSSGNDKLAGLLSELYDQVERLIHLCISRVIPEEMLGYQPLVEALAAGDGDLAARLMVEQIELGRKRIMDALLSSSHEAEVDMRDRTSKKELTLQDFVEHLNDILAITQPDNLPFRIAKRLPRLLRSLNLLTPEQRESSAQSYRRHVLFEDPEGRFTVEALVWEPGQTTPVVGVPFWSVVGIYEGELRESCYRRLRRADGNFRFMPNGVTHHRSGDVTYVDPAPESLHRFDNPTSELAISIHVFGTDRRSSERLTDCYLPDDFATSESTPQ